MSDTKSQYRTRKAIAAGLCITCSKVPPEEGKKRCRICLDYNNGMVKKKYGERSKAGLCPGCGLKPKLACLSSCEDCLNYSASKQRVWALKLKNEVFTKYGGVFCRCCGATDLNALTIDHVNEDGAAHRRGMDNSSGSGFYSWLRKNNYPPGYQVLCFTCNWCKSHGGCKHDKNFAYCLEHGYTDDGF